MSDKAIISIPVQKIMPNPHQPRRSFREGSIQEMADSLTAIGQQTPLKVCPLTEAEKAENAPFEVMVLGGHRRRAGALLAGLEALDCIVLDITPEERGFYALMDNNLDEMDWWDWDVAIYDLYQAASKPSQREFAKRIGKSAAKVNNALNVVGSLTPPAREMIDQNLGKSPSNGPESGQPKKSEKTLIFDVQTLNTKNKVFLISEYTLLALANLKDPLKIERALKVVMDDYLGEPEAKELVVWEAQGNRLEDYSPEKAKAVLNHEGTKASALRPPAEELALSVPIPPKKGIGTTKKGKKQREGLTQQPTQAQTSQAKKPEIATSQTEPFENKTEVPTSLNAPIGAAPRDDSSYHSKVKVAPRNDGNNLQTSNSSLLTTFWKSLAGWVQQTLLKTLRQSVQHTLKHMVGQAVKGAVLFLILGVGVFLFFPGSAAHKIAWLRNVQPPTLLNRQGAKESKADGVTATTNQKPEIATSQTEPIGPAPRNDGNGTQLAASANDGIQAKAPAANSPSELAQPNRGSQLGASTQVKPLSQMQKNAQAALDFASHYYGADYTNLMPWMDFFKEAMVKESYLSFMDRHFPLEWIKKIEHQHWTMSFKPTQPVKLLKSDELSDWFLVEGIMTTRTDIHGSPEMVSQKPVAARILFNRQSVGEDKVAALKELSPDEAQALLDSSPADLTDASNAKSSGSTKIDPVAKAVGDAAGEAAKKAFNLPF